MRDIYKNLIKLSNKASQGGGKERIQAQYKKGKLTARERVSILLDDSSFQEIGKIAGDAEYDENGELKDFRPANFLLGFGKINKRSVVIGGEDFTLKLFPISFDFRLRVKLSSPISMFLRIIGVLETNSVFFPSYHIS